MQVCKYSYEIYLIAKKNYFIKKEEQFLQFVIFYPY